MQCRTTDCAGITLCLSDRISQPEIFCFISPSYSLKVFNDVFIYNQRSDLLTQFLMNKINGKNWTMHMQCLNEFIIKRIII